MGLDMYLYAEKYISAYDFDTIDGEMTRRDNLMYDRVIASADMNTLPSAEYGSLTVRKCVGYWRKANAIHGWFVRELADGRDECQEIRVGREDLIKLRDLCVEALSNRHLATPAEETTRRIDLSKVDEADVPTLLMESMKEQGALSSRTLTAVADPLEPTAGFFFGSTAKDEYYYRDLESTVDIINALLANDDRLDYYYQASW